MTLFVASLLALTALPAISSTENAPIRMMTFNIRYANPNDGDNVWERRREMVYRLLREEKPDVLGLQEALKTQLDEMEKAHPEFAAVGVGRDDGKSAGEHSRILYRANRFDLEDHGTFWFSDTPDVPGSKHWGNTVTRICTWARLRERTSGRTFSVYNVHLDHQSQPSREKSSALLLKRIRERKEQTPVVIMGDFNAGEDNPAVTALKQTTEPKLHDTFRLVNPDASDAGTFHGFHGKPDKDKIDYIFVTDAFTVEAANILRNNENGRYPSDHFPVTALCRLK